ncbi:MAG: hypothetical protein HOC70_00275 [Gammaproteobacteria bacterium]|jgi:hypothetical protein|nr:hypothetical protein [Gammaproteobacteria bacterium]MBT4491648.1 hypothetical protein [Gammaproteobacteria bacterium]MBT7369706.1 hypothetical protein [Gammaproteobacteria bacterium]
MSACHCYNLGSHLGCPELKESRPIRRSNLFSGVTALLVSMWVGIVVIAAELAGPESFSSVPTLEAFLRSLF